MLAPLLVNSVLTLTADADVPSLPYHPPGPASVPSDPITEQVQVMVQKQEAIFERLTNFAVWVQNCTQECSMVELDAREKRDAARRHIVELWVKADEANENYSLVAPSMSVHMGVGNAY